MKNISYFEQVDQLYHNISRGIDKDKEENITLPDVPGDKLLDRIHKIAEYHNLNKYETEIIKIIFTTHYCKKFYHLYDIIKILRILYNKDEAFFLNHFKEDSGLIKKNLIRSARPDGCQFNLEADVLQWILYEDKKVFEKSKSRTKSMIRKISVNRTYNHLRRYVIGQDRILKMVALECANHYLRINSTDSSSLRKNNLLFVGPTGSGKTYILKLIEQLLNIPVLIVDANEFSETGYVGKDVHEIISDLTSKAGGDIRLAEKAIIYIDEIDKVAAQNSIYAHYGNRDVSGRSVQEELLTLIDGTVKSAGYSPFRLGRTRDKMVNTANILFIAGGAFSGIAKLENLGTSSSIGFEPGQHKAASEKKISINDLVDYGMIPEFMGRFGMILQFNKLTPENLRDILLNKNASIINEYKMIAASYGLRVEFTDDAIDLIAQKAHALNTGARSLRVMMNQVVYPEITDTALNKEKKKVVIDAEFVRARLDGNIEDDANSVHQQKKLER